MDQELSDRLSKIEKIVSDNNAMLSKMRRAQKNAAYMRILYWLVIIGLAVVSIYFIMPYLGQLGAAYGIGGSTDSSSTTSTLSNLLKQYEDTQKAAQ